jgi:FkbM family methyltransferase
MFSKLLHCLTVYLPLRLMDLCINFLGLFVGRERIIEAAHKLFKKKSLIGVLPDGSLIFYPLDDFKLLSIISEIYYKKIYDVTEIETCEYICDVGAHIGLFTLRISKEAPNSKVIAFEANPTNFKFLLKNILINGLKDRVCGLNVAVGQRKGRAVLWLSKLSRGDSSTKMWHNAGSAGYLMVDVLPLDDILSNKRSCDLIKIDVEGAETEVLRGLEKKYTKVNRLIMEIHISVVNVNEIYEWLHDHGFVVTKTQKLYEDCLLLEAQRLCA